MGCAALSHSLREDSDLLWLGLKPFDGGKLELPDVFLTRFCFSFSTFARRACTSFNEPSNEGVFIFVSQYLRESVLREVAGLAWKKPTILLHKTALVNPVGQLP